MKYLIVLLLSISVANASDTLDKYYKDYSDRDYIAKQRAAAHPKGSGIGTNKYNIRYDRDYRVDRYVRKPEYKD